MANQSHSGIRGDPWLRCGRCGTDQRSSNLQWQLGLLVCRTNGCVDDLTIQQRPAVINAALASGPDAPPAEILNQSSISENDVEIVF